MLSPILWGFFRRQPMTSSCGHRSSPPYCAFDHFLVLDYLPKFLRKFTRLKSLVVEFDYSGSGGGNNNDLNFTKQPALKWTFDSNSWCFILVMAPRSIDEEGKNIYATEADLHEVVFDIHFGIFVCTCIVMGGLFRCLPESVARVVITDSKKQGKIGFGQADLLEIASQVRPFMTAEEESKFLLKIWEESTLEELQMNGAMCDAMALLPSPDMKVATFFSRKPKAKGKGKGEVQVGKHYCNY